MPIASTCLIPPDRWRALMADDTLPLTQAEISHGWHFCVDWDGLLVGPGMGEVRHCHCGLITIHHLHAGVTACNKPGVPKDWEPSHFWESDWGLVNCRECLKKEPPQSHEPDKSHIF